MFCWNCGKEIPDTSMFCAYCGKEAATVAESTEPVLVETPGSVETIPVEVPGSVETIPVEAPGSVETIPVEAPGSVETIPVEVPGSVETIPVEAPGSAAPVFAEAPASAEPVPVEASTSVEPLPVEVPTSVGPVIAEASDSTVVSPFAAAPAAPATTDAPTGTAAYATPDVPPSMGEQPVPPHGLPLGTQPQMAKKRSKMPFIIIGAVVLALIIGGAIAAVATGFFGLMGSRPAIQALYEGSENLIYNTSSATLELTVATGEEKEKLTIKWDYGKDLRDSTIWLGYKEESIVIRGDTMYISDTTWDGEKSIESRTGWIDEVNKAFFEIYKTEIDVNMLVKDGTLNRVYIEQLNRKMNENMDSMDDYFYGLPNEEVDTERTLEIFDSFMRYEVGKKEVQDKFMSEVETNRSGQKTTYKAEIDLLGFVLALSDYANDRRSDSSYEEAAQLIIDLASDLKDGMTFSEVGKLKTEISVENNVLVGLVLSLKSEYGFVGFQIEVTDVNKTDLSNDSALEEIYSSATPANEAIV